MEQLPRDLERDGGFAGPRSQCQQDAALPLGHGFQHRVDRARLVVAGLPLAAVRLERDLAEAVAPCVAGGVTAVPQLHRRGHGVHFALRPGMQVNLVIAQPVGAIGKARAYAGGVVVSLPAPLGIGQAGFLGLHHGHDMAVHPQYVIGGLGGVRPAPRHDPTGPEHFFAVHPRAVAFAWPFPALGGKVRVDPHCARIGLGLVGQRGLSRHPMNLASSQFPRKGLLEQRLAEIGNVGEFCGEVL